MDIKTQTLEQLKSLAYDQLVLFNQTQNNLKLLEQEILEREKSKLAALPIVEAVE